MDFIYASDENYVRHAAASMVSLMENNRQADEVVFHFLSMGIKSESKRILEELCARYGRRVTVYELGDLKNWFSFEFNARGFAQSTLARLLVGRILPEKVERALYVDCDTIVLDDLSPLFSLDMGRNYVGMVAEPTATKGRRVQLALKDEQPYFNAGILLINLKLWRQENAEKQVLDYYAAHDGNLLAPDQDALNGAFAGRILELQPRYNFGSVQIYYPWKAQKRISSPTPFMDEETYRQGTEKPAIIHYLGEERPWREGNRHRYRDKYDLYLNMTPWANYPKDKGWQAYFVCFSVFNTLVKPFPVLRWRIIDRLIPVFMKHREKKLKKR